MQRDSQFKPVLFWLILMAFVLSLSTLSTRLWGEKPETTADVVSLKAWGWT